jgi:hypothetical protein
MTAPAPSIDYAALKSGGIIMQKDDDFFAIRLRLPGGYYPCRPSFQSRPSGQEVRSGRSSPHRSAGDRESLHQL